MEQRNDLVSLCPEHVDSEEHSVEEITPGGEQFDDFLEITSDIEIDLDDIKMAGDREQNNLLNVKEHEQLSPDESSLINNPDGCSVAMPTLDTETVVDIKSTEIRSNCQTIMESRHRPLTTEPDQSEHTDISKCDLTTMDHGDSLCIDRSPEGVVKDTIDKNTPWDTVDYVAKETSLDKINLTKAESVLCNSNVSEPVKTSFGEKPVYPLPRSDFICLELFTENDEILFNTVEEVSSSTVEAVSNSTVESVSNSTVESVSNSTGSPHITGRSTVSNATSVRRVSSCKILKTPISSTDICNRKDNFRVLSNSDTAVGKTHQGRILPRDYLNPELNDIRDVVHETSDRQVTGETLGFTWHLALTGNMDDSTSQQNYGQGEGDFVVVDDYNSLVEDGSSDDIVELIEREETDFDQLMELLNQFGKDHENEAGESIFETLTISGGLFVEETSNMYDNIPSESDIIPNASLEDLVKPNESLHENTSTKLAMSFQQVQEKEISESSDTQKHVGDAVADVNSSTDEHNSESGCSCEQDKLNVYGIIHNDLTKLKCHEKKQANEVFAIGKSSKLDIPDAAAETFKSSTLPIPNNSFELYRIPKQLNVESFERQKEKEPSEIHERDKSDIEKSPDHISGDDTGKSNALTFESHIVPGDIMDSNKPSQLNETLSCYEQGKEKEPGLHMSEIIEVHNVSGTTADNFNYPVTQSVQIHGDYFRKDKSTIHDSLSTKLNEILDSFEKQEKRETPTAVESPKEIHSSAADSFNFSTLKTVSKLDDSFFQDMANLRASIDNKLDKLLNSFETRQCNSVQNDSTKVNNRILVPNHGHDVIPEKIPISLSVEDILPVMCDESNSEMCPESDYVQIETLQNDSYLNNSISPDLQSTLKHIVFSGNSSQFHDNEEPIWNLEVDSDIKKYSEMLFQEDSPSGSHLKSLKTVSNKGVQKRKNEFAEQDNYLSLNAVVKNRNSISTLESDRPSPMTDSMSLNDFFEMTKKLAHSDNSWEQCGETCDEFLSKSPIGEFHPLDTSIELLEDMSDFDFFEGSTKYQELPFYDCEESSTKFNESSLRSYQQNE